MSLKKGQDPSSSGILVSTAFYSNISILSQVRVTVDTDTDDKTGDVLTLVSTRFKLLHTGSKQIQSLQYHIRIVKAKFYVD